MSDPINEAWKRFLVTEGLDEACNRYFDPDTGHFTSKEEAAKKGGTYSISKAASDRCGDVVAKPGKMKVTGKGKLQTKFTLAQCGRKNAQTGDKKRKDKRCRDYPKGRYGDENTFWFALPKSTQKNSNAVSVSSVKTAVNVLNIVSSRSSISSLASSRQRRVKHDRRNVGLYGRDHQ